MGEAAGGGPDGGARARLEGVLDGHGCGGCEGGFGAYIDNIEFVEAVGVAVVWFVGGDSHAPGASCREEADDEACWVVCGWAFSYGLPMRCCPGIGVVLWRVL